MKTEIPGLDLQAQYLSIQSEIDEAVARVLVSGQYILGHEVEAFEQEFAHFCSLRHACGVDSGTSALQLALLACGIGPGDEVITVSHTAVATVAAIELTGARPTLVDIDPVRYTLDPGQLASALTPQTRAILPVHIYGCPADLEPILAFARQHQLFVIEDCAQAHGARYQGKSVGSWGTLATFSFYPTKNLGAYGDGGIILTNDPAMDSQLRRLRQYGWDRERVSQRKGLNARLDELQAAILRVKLHHLEAWNERRRTLATFYRSKLTNTDVILPVEPADAQHVFHQFVIRHPKRDALRKFLAKHGIQTQIHYPLPIHLQPAYQHLRPEKDALRMTETIAQEILSLPIYPELSENAVERICAAIRDF